MRPHVNTTAVQVMPIVPVNARTRVVARYWPGKADTHRPHLRVLVWEGGRAVACWTVTYP